jgi:hypothetical protein
MCALLRRHATGSPNPNDIHGNAATQPLRFLQCLACATLPFGGYSSRGQSGRWFTTWNGDLCRFPSHTATGQDLLGLHVDEALPVRAKARRPLFDPGSRIGFVILSWLEGGDMKEVASGENGSLRCR